MRFLGLGFEALKLDFLDDGRDIGFIPCFPVAVP
jgi:hypothetical protein